MELLQQNGNGSVAITAKAGEKSATCMVTVTTKATKAVLSNSNIILDKNTNTTKTLTLTIKEPEAAKNNKITWTSSNKSVAIVNTTGTVTAVSPGTTIITAKVDNISASCNVTVRELSSNTNLSKITINNKEITATELNNFNTGNNPTIYLPITTTSINISAESQDNKAKVDISNNNYTYPLKDLVSEQITITFSITAENGAKISRNLTIKRCAYVDRLFCFKKFYKIW